MGKKNDDIAAIKKDDRNIEMARRGWEENTEDEALELLKELRNDVREGE